MNAPEPDEESVDPTPPSPARYSPFGVLLGVFLTLIALQAFYLRDGFRERSQMKAAQAQMAKPLADANTVNLTIERVGQELLALAAARNVEAAKIVAEFNMASNAPSPANARSVPVAPSTARSNAPPVKKVKS